MPKITLHNSNGIEVHEYDSQKTLLQTIQSLGGEVFAPCGGHGTCGKCTVKVKEIGRVTSCLYYPKGDIEVYLPTKRESKVLTDQHKYTLSPEIDCSCHGKGIAIAVDIGTTSVALYMVSLENGHVLSAKGKHNSQGQYGADVISRINYSAEDGGLATLQKAVIGDIKELIEAGCKALGLDKTQIVRMSIAANTTMLHLLMGVDSMSIALAPFEPVFTEAKIFPASELGFQLSDDATIHLLPSISAYVGADIVAGIAALNPPKDIKKYLFVDVGTNGEMAMVAPDKILSCSTAAGPALEGANISCGMGAYPGAITSYKKKGFKTINNEKPVGLCGPGLIEAVAYMLDEGILGMDGVLQEDFVLVPKEESGTGADITLTPQDIREVQLAKSAIYSGIIALLEQTDSTFEDVDALFLAGGMGNYMNIKSAIRIGLLPQEMKGKIIQVGNTAGAGATLDVCSQNFSKRADEIVAKSDHFDLSNDSNFTMNFAMNTFFS